MGLNDAVLTAVEAADLLKVSEKTVLRMAREGELPGQKVGRAWRFCRTDLLSFLGQERVNA
jgi:excisionase family DNA binding protein